MADVHIRREGHAGRVTLTRASALNALNYEMCLELDAALRAWAADPDVALVILDAEGDRAFCAGGDIAEIYARGRAGDYDYARQFWADEYRMNARMAQYPKPIVTFMQGFVMGGGVGLGCHASHRIVDESVQIAMPECGIGLVPDVGGSLLLARAPGALGAYLGLTGARMGPGDALRAGFADLFVPQADWAGAKAALIASGDIAVLRGQAAPEGALAPHQALIDRIFALPDVGPIMAALAAEPGEFAAQTLKTLHRNAPLAMACTLQMQRKLGRGGSIEAAVAQEYRYTWRAMAQGDFLEGIRAAIIDRDKSPRWQHDGPAAVTPAEVAAMLADLGADDLSFEEKQEGTA